MIRVVVMRPSMEDDYDRPMEPLGHPTVYASDPVPIGLLDADGRMLYRVTDEIGFYRKDHTHDASGTK